MTVVELNKFKKSKKGAVKKVAHREAQIKELVEGSYITHDFLTGLTKILRRYEKEHAPVTVEIDGKNIKVEKCVNRLIEIHEELLEKYGQFLG
jgi:hypothetical protein